MSFVGVTQLKQKLDQNYNDCKINKLCRRSEGGEVEFLCFASAVPLDFAGDFNIMTQNSVSEFFPIYWRQQCEVLARSATLADMPQVWETTFRNCKVLLKSVQDQTITLVDVDRQFHQYHQKSLETQLTNLHHGVCLCTGVSPANDKKEARLIRSAVGRMGSYWDLCNYRDTANVFLNIRDALNLTKGDFGDVEKLSEEVLTF